MNLELIGKNIKAKKKKVSTNANPIFNNNVGTVDNNNIMTLKN